METVSSVEAPVLNTSSATKLTIPSAPQPLKITEEAKKGMARISISTTPKAKVEPQKISVQAEPKQEAEIEKLAEAPYKHLNQDSFTLAWRTYAFTKENDPRLRSLLELYVPELCDFGLLKVTLENHNQAAVLRDEKTALFEFLKTKFPENKFNLAIEVNEGKESAKAFTAAERWEALLSRNEVLNKLKKRLDLDLE